jgi:hypothetical protein
MVKMSIEKKLFRRIFLLMLLTIVITGTGLFAYSIYDVILYSKARDNKIVRELFFDIDLEDQVLIMKALARREEPYFEDIAFEIQQRYSERDAYKYELLVRTLVEAILEQPDPGLIRQRIIANSGFFEAQFLNLGALADPGCKGKIIVLLDFDLKPEYVSVLASEAGDILNKVKENGSSAEHFLPETLALMEFAEKHLNKEFLYFGSQMIQKVKNEDAYQQIKKIIYKLLE